MEPVSFVFLGTMAAGFALPAIYQYKNTYDTYKH